MELCGFFQSEKYFAHHKKEIIELFAPSAEITAYLTSHYKDIIDHPNTVPMHTRSYYREDPNGNCHITYGREYVEKAIRFFPEDALFIVFSNDIPWCRTILSDIPRQMIFIEGESYHHDFYLMSLCKHNIICNSSFFWWAAYLNSNPDKVIVAPKMWVNPTYIANIDDIKPDGWIQID